MRPILVVHHSADYDGIFCREIARKFLPHATFIGWDFGMPRVEFPPDCKVLLLDLPPDCFGVLSEEEISRLIWIDHHKSAIDKWGMPNSGFEMNGYRIDGVAACRLAWQYLGLGGTPTAMKEQFLNREVDEPYAVTLAGEYDVWDHVKSGGQDIAFQFGLDTVTQIDWPSLLSTSPESYATTVTLIDNGYIAQRCFAKRDAEIIWSRGFDLDFEGRKFLALNTSRKGSQQFMAGIKDHHDACLAFFWTGSIWVVGMYHDRIGKRDIDLSQIAVKYGGGGHRRACGFQAKTLPWLS